MPLITRKYYYYPMPKLFRPKKKAIKFEEGVLYLKDLVTSEVSELGIITTLKGKLTRAQKLKAVEYKGQWVNI